METKKFNCKMEEVPALAGFIAESLSENLPDFSEYSSTYTESTVKSILDKRTHCLELVRSGDVTLQLKNVTSALNQKEKSLRPMLNKLEGYVSRASENLDLAPAQFGVKNVRSEITRSNDEGVIAAMHTLINNITRNEEALLNAGLKAELTEEFTSITKEIDTLNNEQNRLENLRSTISNASIKDFNELWDMLNSVCRDARAIYKGVDDVKLKNFTITTLIKRIHAEGKRKAKDEPVNE